MTSLIFWIILSIKICVVVSIEKKGRRKREKPKKKKRITNERVVFKKERVENFSIDGRVWEIDLFTFWVLDAQNLNSQNFCMVV